MKACALMITILLPCSSLIYADPSNKDIARGEGRGGGYRSFDHSYDRGYQGDRAYQDNRGYQGYHYNTPEDRALEEGLIDRNAIENEAILPQDVQIEQFGGTYSGSSISPGYVSNPP